MESLLLKPYEDRMMDMIKSATVVEPSDSHSIYLPDDGVSENKI